MSLIVQSVSDVFSSGSVEKLARDVATAVSQCDSQAQADLPVRAASLTPICSFILHMSFFARARSAGQAAPDVESATPADSQVQATSATRATAFSVRRGIGIAPTDGEGSTLQPDASFGAAPWIPCAQSLVTSAATMVSVGALSAALPLAPDSRTPEPSALVVAPVGLAILVSLACHVYYLSIRHRCVRMQLGPLDASTSGAAASLQYEFLWAQFMRQHVASHISDIVVLTGMAVSTILFGIEIQDAHASPEWRMIVQPLALCGLLALCINTFFRLRCD
jgi:hypothetical protein